MSASIAVVPGSATEATAIIPRRWSRRIAIDVVGFLDAAAIVAGGIAPAMIYAWGGGLTVDWPKHLQICFVSAVIVYGCLRNYGMYDVNRIHDLPASPKRLGASLLIAFLAIFGLGLPFAPRQMDLWMWYAVWITMSFMLLVNIRNFAHWLLGRLTRAGVFDDRVAVYGSGTIARRVEEYLADSTLGIRFAGLFDDRVDTKRGDAEGPRLAGRLDDLIARARAGDIDRIIISLPQAADHRTQQIARRLEQLPVSLHVVTHIASDLVDDGPAHRVSALGPVGLLDVKGKPLSGWSRWVKGAEDYGLGSIFLLLAAPVLLLAALAIKLDSPGPVFFRQRRKGLNQEIFEVVKFRTMDVMEDGANIAQATRNDPRVTRVGRILRRWSIDELPQLLNVVKGEMSLVGPRPHALAHDDRFAEIVARYPNRHQMKPGMTGLAQVEGLRGEIETAEMLEKRLEKDLAYVSNWSLWLDLKILARTPFGCFKATTAY